MFWSRVWCGLCGRLTEPCVGGVAVRRHVAFQVSRVVSCGHVCAAAGGGFWGIGVVLSALVCIDRVVRNSSGGAAYHVIDRCGVGRVVGQLSEMRSSDNTTTRGTRCAAPLQRAAVVSRRLMDANSRRVFTSRRRVGPTRSVAGGGSGRRGGQCTRRRAWDSGCVFGLISALDMRVFGGCVKGRAGDGAVASALQYLPLAWWCFFAPVAARFGVGCDRACLCVDGE